MRFLYVEDDAQSREVMELTAEYELRVEVVIFPDSHNFEEKLLSLDPMPSLIFLDIHVEPITGFQMLEIIRSHSIFNQIPVVALTASVMNDEVQRLREVGFTGAFAKPIDIDRFPQLVDAVLNGEVIWDIYNR